jgi:hypothetical protein
MEVIGMFKNKKIGSNQRIGKLEKRKLRMLRSDQALQALPVSVEGADQESVCEDSQKEIRTAMLEADYQKAKALMAFQNNRRYY